MPNDDLAFIHKVFSSRMTIPVNGLPFVIQNLDYVRVPKFGDFAPFFTGSEIPVKGEFDLDTVVTIQLITVMCVGGPSKRANITIEGDADYVAGLIKSFMGIKENGK